MWWDHAIAPGTQWDQTIQRELNAAKCIVAIWSARSVSSPWVKEESSVGKARNALVPVRIDNVEPPLGFTLIQAADLQNWDGDIEDPHWDFFIESIRAVLSGEPVTGMEKPPKAAPQGRSPLIAAIAVGVVAGGGLYIAQSLRSPSTPAAGPAVSSAGPAGPSSTPPAAAEPSDGERALFDKAQKSALKSDYQDYLRTFPRGFYAQRIREEILPICRGETRPAWMPLPQPIGQVFRAASATEDPAGDPVIFKTKKAACDSAVASFKQSAKRYCRAFTATLESRNEKLGIDIAECECQQVQDRWFCFTDSTYSCTYEFKSQKYVEVCN